MTRRALLLAAGRGQRMRPLTDTCPKPLLPVRGKPLLDWWVDALVRDGVDEIVINTAWLEAQIGAHMEARAAAGALGTARLTLSNEARDFGHALETAGGIARALPRLAPHAGDVFWAIAADAYAPEFAFDAALEQRFRASDALAHLWLVPNPPHHADGDFALCNGRATAAATAGAPRLTFSGIALYRRALFTAPWCALAPGNPEGMTAPLAPLLRRALAAGRVSAEHYGGTWVDVGTPERLAALRTCS